MTVADVVFDLTPRKFRQLIMPGFETPLRSTSPSAAFARDPGGAEDIPGILRRVPDGRVSDSTLGGGALGSGITLAPGPPAIDFCFSR